jgi:glycosyltransferase involved in cell wall biosynthesis
MRILLVGEYSRLHNSLKEGLQVLGHEVLLISTGDFFKKYPSDILLARKYDSGIPAKIKVGIYKLLGVDITSRSIKNQFLKHQEQLKGFDVVQLINESPFAIQPQEEKAIIHFLSNHNKKLFLLSCGADYVSVSHAMSDTHPYSVLSGYKDGMFAKERFVSMTKYLTAPFKDLHDFIYDRISGVIASDMDYHLPLLDHPKYVGLIANPVNLSRLTIPEIKVTEPIVIFMGINRGNYHTKGIQYFEEALEIIKKKYGEHVKIDIVENLPYTEYIQRYNKAHILLDQVLAYDQGYNALEAMAKGKVVFTGAETEFEKHYALVAPVAINALPDTRYLVNELSTLIENPNLIIEIGERAKAFVAAIHDHVVVARSYVTVWNSSEKKTVEV